MTGLRVYWRVVQYASESTLKDGITPSNFSNQIKTPTYHDRYMNKKIPHHIMLSFSKKIKLSALTPGTKKKKEIFPTDH